MIFDLDCGAGFRPKLMLSLCCFGLLSLLLGSYTIGSSYLAVSGHGDWSVPGQEMVILLCLLGIILMAVSLLGLLFSKVRCMALAVFLGCGLLVTVGIFSLETADHIRMQGFQRLALEAAPLVTAIHAYTTTHGIPPENLDDLEVKFPADHSIQGAGLPEFKYLPGDIARERYHGNPWVLMLETPTGPLRWDRFLYYPLQNYPPLGHGGWFERVGEWAYLHE